MTDLHINKGVRGVKIHFPRHRIKIDKHPQDEQQQSDKTSALDWKSKLEKNLHLVQPPAQHFTKESCLKNPY